MPLSDYIEPSVEEQNRRSLFDRYLRVRDQLMAVKLSELDMTGEEFFSYNRILSRSIDPNEIDIALFESKLEKLAQQRS